jgi:hypothetical protein
MSSMETTPSPNDHCSDTSTPFLIQLLAVEQVFARALVQQLPARQSADVFVQQCLVGGHTWSHVLSQDTKSVPIREMVFGTRI